MASLPATFGPYPITAGDRARAVRLPQNTRWVQFAVDGVYWVRVRLDAATNLLASDAHYMIPPRSIQTLPAPEDVIQAVSYMADLGMRVAPNPDLIESKMLLTASSAPIPVPVAYAVGLQDAPEVALPEHLWRGLSVLDYHAQMDGITDDTQPLRDALADAARTGRRLTIPDGEMLITQPIALPDGVTTDFFPTISISGTASEFVTYQYDARMQRGTRIRYTGPPGTHLFSASPNSTTHERPIYRFSHLAIIGPDDPATGNTTSGDAIHIAGTSVSTVILDDVRIARFRGGNGIYLSNVEDSSLRDVMVYECGTGVQLENNTNAISCDNVGVQQCVGRGIGIENCYVQHWRNTLIQSNHRTGLWIRGGHGLTFDTAYYEGNNMDAAADAYGIHLDPTPTRKNESIRFVNNFFSGSNPGGTILLDTISGGQNLTTVFEGGPNNQTGGVWLTIDGADCLDTRVVNFLDESRISDSGSRTRIEWHNPAYISDSGESWHNIGTTGEPAFQNGWDNHLAPPAERVRFRKVASNRVELQGLISGGASGSIAFVLPAGYQPTETVRVPLTVDSGEAARLDIHTNGNVVISAPATMPTWISVAGAFYAGPDST